MNADEYVIKRLKELDDLVKRLEIKNRQQEFALYTLAKHARFTRISGDLYLNIGIEDNKNKHDNDLELVVEALNMDAELYKEREEDDTEKTE